MTEETALATIDLPLGLEDEAKMMNQLIAIPIDAMPPIALKITELRKSFGRLEAVAEARLRAEWAKLIEAGGSLNGAWKHPETNQHYVMDGDSKWDVQGPEAFEKALLEAWQNIGILDGPEGNKAQTEEEARANPRVHSTAKIKLLAKIRAAFPREIEVKHQPLNGLITEHPALAAVIFTHRSKKYGPTHLVEADKPESKR